jgi:hypothetical protein
MAFAPFLYLFIPTSAGGFLFCIIPPFQGKLRRKRAKIIGIVPKAPAFFREGKLSGSIIAYPSGK